MVCQGSQNHLGVLGQCGLEAVLVRLSSDLEIFLGSSPAAHWNQDRAWTTVGSQKLEHGCRMSYAGFPDPSFTELPTGFHQGMYL